MNTQVDVDMSCDSWTDVNRLLSEQFNKDYVKVVTYELDRHSFPKEVTTIVLEFMAPTGYQIKQYYVSYSTFPYMLYSNMSETTQEAVYKERILLTKYSGTPFLTRLETWPICKCSRYLILLLQICINDFPQAFVKEHFNNKINTSLQQEWHLIQLFMCNKCPRRSSSSFFKPNRSTKVSEKLRLIKIHKVSCLKTRA